MVRRLLLALALSAIAALADDSRPNVILFVTDDQSPDTGCDGNPAPLNMAAPKKPVPILRHRLKTELLTLRTHG